MNWKKAKKTNELRQHMRRDRRQRIIDTLNGK